MLLLLLLHEQIVQYWWQEKNFWPKWKVQEKAARGRPAFLLLSL